MLKVIGFWSVLLFAAHQFCTLCYIGLSSVKWRFFYSYLCLVKVIRRKHVIINIYQHIWKNPNDCLSRYLGHFLTLLICDWARREPLVCFFSQASRMLCWIFTLWFSNEQCSSEISFKPESIWKTFV